MNKKPCGARQEKTQKMNTVMLIGTLTRDPELKEREKTKICDMRLVEAGGRREAPLYIDVSTFGRQAEVCSQYLSKGRQVAISGQLRFREWESDDGNKRSMHTIAAEHIDFLTGAGVGGGKKRGGGGKSSGGKGGGRGRGRESRSSSGSSSSGSSSGSSGGSSSGGESAPTGKSSS
jgi:single-strand DNA-binding protein